MSSDDTNDSQPTLDMSGSLQNKPQIYGMSFLAEGRCSEMCSSWVIIQTLEPAGLHKDRGNI